MELDDTNYYKFLLQNQRQYSLPKLSDYIDDFAQSTIQNYVKEGEIDPTLFARWEPNINLANGDILFDDRAILCPQEASSELLSATSIQIESELMHLIGVVTCIYFDREQQNFNILDRWIYYPGMNGKNKLNCTIECITNILANSELQCQYVLMDFWYAAQKFMAAVDLAKKIYYCPLKPNRLVRDRENNGIYQPIATLEWTALEKEQGKIIQIKNFPKHKKLKLFALDRAEESSVYIVTNDLTQSSLQEVMDIYIFRCAQGDS